MQLAFSYMRQISLRFIKISLSGIYSSTVTISRSNNADQSSPNNFNPTPNNGPNALNRHNTVHSIASQLVSSTERYQICLFMCCVIHSIISIIPNLTNLPIDTVVRLAKASMIPVASVLHLAIKIDGTVYTDKSNYLPSLHRSKIPKCCWTQQIITVLCGG